MAHASFDEPQETEPHLRVWRGRWWQQSGCWSAGRRSLKSCSVCSSRLPSPPFPSYTSGHSTFSAAGARLLALWFGTDDIEFSVTSDALPGAVRHFKKLSDAQKEAGMSRVVGGIHTMSDNLQGQAMGIKIADWTWAKALQPVTAAK